MHELNSGPDCALVQNRRKRHVCSLLGPVNVSVLKSVDRSIVCNRRVVDRYPMGFTLLLEYSHHLVNSDREQEGVNVLWRTAVVLGRGKIKHPGVGVEEIADADGDTVALICEIDLLVG